MTGGYQGHVAGSISAAPRRIGVEDQGVSVDATLDMTQGGRPMRFLLSVFDADGSGPKVVHALFGEIDPVATMDGWTAGLDQGTAGLAPDGSVTSFDLQFKGSAIAPAALVVGSISCPGLP